MLPTCLAPLGAFGLLCSAPECEGADQKDAWGSPRVDGGCVFREGPALQPASEEPQGQMGQNVALLPSEICLQSDLGKT